MLSDPVSTARPLDLTVALAIFNDNSQTMVSGSLLNLMNIGSGRGDRLVKLADRSGMLGWKAKNAPGRRCERRSSSLHAH